MRPSMSKLSLLAACGYFARPEVKAPELVMADDWIADGRAFHECVQFGLDGGCDEARAVYAKHDADGETVRTWLDRWFESPLPATAWEHEFALAYDWHHDTARALDAKGRDYQGIRDSEIPGTVDLYRLDGERVVVLDLKNGRQADHAPGLAQLRGYALALCRLHRKSAATIAIAHVTADGVFTTVEEMDEFALDAVAAGLFERMAHLDGAKPQPGPHCGRCPAAGVCPEAERAETAIIAAPRELAITSPGQASALLQRLRQVEAAAKHVEQALKAYADANGGIPTGDGKVWRKVTTERETISLSGDNNAAGIAAIAAVGALDAVETKATTSKAAIERSLRAQGLVGKELKAKVDALCEDLRNAGVMKVAQIDSYRETKA